MKVQKFKHRFRRVILFYLALSVLTLFYKNSNYKLPILLSEYIERNQDITPKGHPEPKIKSLQILIKNEFFKHAKIGIWQGNEKNHSHNSTFELQVACRYFSLDPKNFNRFSSLEKMKTFDYIVSPWDDYALVDYGATIIHKENRLFVYIPKK